MHNNKLPIFLLIVITISISLFALTTSVSAKSIIENEWEKIIEENENLDIENQVTFIKSRFKLAVAYANTGEIELAMDEIANLNKNNGWTLTHQFIRECEMKYEQTPDDLINLNYLAFAYYVGFQYDKSILFFEKIIEIDKENVWPYHYLALVHGSLKHYDIALEILDQALDIEKNKFTHVILSGIYYEKGNYFKAAWHLAKSGKWGVMFLKGN